ncbi:DUF2637 domain-containing protein, partial [Actinomadura sp. 6K520]|uniref:DUF2637 domain-containing protein n=1 Tax=Actinomadura sp. 6K520 TaxID=2530364 RepID=UPI00104C3196
MPSDRTRPGGPRYTPVQRRLLTALTGLIVAALAGGAFAVTYDVLRELALAGRAGARWAPLYPAMADTLTVLTMLSLVITRNARWWTRLPRWALLLLLVAGGAALSVQHSVWGFGSLPEDAVRAGVAVAPHVMLVIAVWLWLTMFKQIRVARPSAEEVSPPDTQRGHVKVLEPAAPEPPAPTDPDAAAESAPAFLDDPEPEPEPLIPFPEPEHVPDAAPAYEAASDETAPQDLVVHDDLVHDDLVDDAPAEREPADEAPAEEAPAEEAPAAREPVAREEFAAGGSLSSEPAPPLDALPEPRPSLDP